MNTFRHKVRGNSHNLIDYANRNRMEGGDHWNTFRDLRCQGRMQGERDTPASQNIRILYRKTGLDRGSVHQDDKHILRAQPKFTRQALKEYLESAAESFFERATRVQHPFCESPKKSPREDYLIKQAGTCSTGSQDSEDQPFGQNNQVFIAAFGHLPKSRTTSRDIKNRIIKP